MTGRAPNTLTPAATWATQAACRSDDPAKYFDERYLPRNLACRRCPVAEQCLAEAMDAEGSTAASMRFGIFGGLTSKERAALAKGWQAGKGALIIAAAPVPLNARGPEPTEPCGTRAAYRRHQRHGQTPCAACRAAESRHRAKRRAVA